MVQVLKNIGKAIRPVAKVAGTIANGISLVAGVITVGFTCADKISEWTKRKDELTNEIDTGAVVQGFEENNEKLEDLNNELEEDLIESIEKLQENEND